MGTDQSDKILEMLYFPSHEKKNAVFLISHYKTPEVNVSSINYFTKHHLNRTNVMPSH